MSTASPVIQLNTVTKTFGTASRGTTALEDVSLEVRRGEFVCVVGPSGCGKSTLFNLITGLDKPTRGTIQAQGRIGLMFQEAALFPWLSVRKNIAFGLTIRKKHSKENPKERPEVIHERVDALLQKIRLEQFAENYPHELSGGMRQRVALARTLILQPDILLMDEPFSALDAQTREALHEQLQQLWQETRPTILFVTHDIREACFLADRIVVLSARPGRVQKVFTNTAARPREYFDPQLDILGHEIKSLLTSSV